MTNSNLQNAVFDFMTAAGQSPDEFDAGTVCLYTGLQFEELGEKLQAIAGGAVSGIERDHLLNMVEAMKMISDEFKRGLHRGAILRADREELLDADIDLAWVALGSAYKTSSDTAGAIGEVARANLDKVPGGVATRDANGKIQKPHNWKAPNLKPFIAPIID